MIYCRLSIFSAKEITSFHKYSYHFSVYSSNINIFNLPLNSSIKISISSTSFINQDGTTFSTKNLRPPKNILLKSLLFYANFVRAKVLATLILQPSPINSYPQLTINTLSIIASEVVRTTQKYFNSNSTAKDCIFLFITRNQTKISNSIHLSKI